jgi:hypothetical protein
MANKDRPPRPEGERARAVQRLNEVVTERRRLRGQPATETGTSGEVLARTSLRANEQTTARERSLESVDKPELSS